MQPTIIAAATLILLTACGGGGSPSASTATSTSSSSSSSSSSSTSTTTTTAATPSTPTNDEESLPLLPPEISKAQAGEEYLAIVAPYNKALRALAKEAKKDVEEFGSPSRAEFNRLKPLSETLADTNRAFSLALLDKSQRWPIPAMDTAQKLAEETTKEQAYLRAMAKAKTPAAWQEAWNAWPDTDNSAELLRQQLGLPERS